MATLNELKAMEHKIAYNTSKDYNKLYEIISKGYRVSGWIIDDKRKKIVEIKMSDLNLKYYSIGTPGIGYEDFTKTKEDFIKNCEKLELEYITPNKSEL